MLRVGPALYVLVRFLRHLLTHLPFYLSEVRNISIVHDTMDAECERVVVRRCDGCCGRGPNMCQHDGARCVGAYAAEVRIVEGRLDGFVESRVEGCRGQGASGESGESRCVPLEGVSDCSLG